MECKYIIYIDGNGLGLNIMQKSKFHSSAQKKAHILNIRLAEKRKRRKKKKGRKKKEKKGKKEENYKLVRNNF